MNISIRKFKKSDAKIFHEAVLASVDNLSKWLPWCTPDYSIADATEWAKSASETWENGTDYRFIIEDLNSGMILGSIGINQIVNQHQIGNLGYWVRSSVLGKGICTNAAKQAVTFAFRELNLKRIEIHVVTDNVASNSVALKIGGVYEGTFRNKLIFNGVSVPAKCYSIIPSDYKT